MLGVILAVEAFVKAGVGGQPGADYSKCVVAFPDRMPRPGTAGVSVSTVRLPFELASRLLKVALPCRVEIDQTCKTEFGRTEPVIVDVRPIEKGTITLFS